MAERTDVLGIPIDHLDLEAATQWVVERAKSEGPLALVHTVNIDHLALALEDGGFRDVSIRAELSVADGTALVWGARAIGIRLPGRVAGVDLFTAVCRTRESPPLRVFLLGGMPAVTEAAAAVIASFGGATVVGWSSPERPALFDAAESRRICDEVNRTGAQVLAVALGAPLQEMWVDQHRNDLEAAVAIGVGGTLDFIAGAAARAPRWMQTFGLEWLHRLLQDPRRLAYRYLVRDPPVAWRLGSRALQWWALHVWTIVSSRRGRPAPPSVRAG